LVTVITIDSIVPLVVGFSNHCGFVGSVPFRLGLVFKGYLSRSIVQLYFGWDFLYSVFRVPFSVLITFIECDFVVLVLVLVDSVVFWAVVVVVFGSVELFN